ncbi:MAG: hypothetical protein FK731_02930, partial [Asgard group archaeon]|nr:hypothetical protein [Asgard group archaeon]
MKETTIAFVTFFMTIFLLIQIKIIGRIRKLIKKGKMGEKTHNQLMFSSNECNWIWDCCNDCIDGCFMCLKKHKEDIDEEEDEKKITERSLEEQREYQVERDQARIKRNERIEILKERGFKASEENKKKVLELINIKPRINISWVSSVVRIPEEEIIIIEDEQEFEISDEYIVNTKMLEEEEKKQQINDSKCEG